MSCHLIFIPGSEPKCLIYSTSLKLSLDLRDLMSGCQEQFWPGAFGSHRQSSGRSLVGCFSHENTTSSALCLRFCWRILRLFMIPFTLCSTGSKSAPDHLLKQLHLCLIWPSNLPSETSFFLQGEGVVKVTLLSSLLKPWWCKTLIIPAASSSGQVFTWMVPDSLGSLDLLPAKWLHHLIICSRWSWNLQLLITVSEICVALWCSLAGSHRAA